MKSLVFVLLLGWFLPYPPTVDIEEVKHLNGLYTGTLTYLDYTSNETVRLLLVGNCYVDGNKLVQEFTMNEWGKTYRQKYAYEFKNGAIHSDGALTLEDKKYDESTKNFRYILTQRGKDGNENKSCVFRYTVQYENDVLTITKDVKFDGENDFFNRNEYKLTRFKG